MLMDPLTALSVAGTIIQFVQFGGQILNGSRQFYESASGALSVNEELEVITRDLSDLLFKLERPLGPSNPPDSLEKDAEYRGLEDIGAHCRKVANELLTRLNGLKIRGKHQAWKSLQHAIKAAWAQREVDELDKRLVGFRRSLETHIISSLR